MAGELHQPEYVWGQVLQAFDPGEEETLARWSELNIVLPEGSSARGGRFRNWPYFVEPLNSMGDPAVERVTFMKPTRVGYTVGLVVFVCATIVKDPCPILMVLPTDQDCKDVSLDDVDPIIKETPIVRKLVAKTRLNRERMLRKRFLGGASLKLVAARSPRNLRHHDAKYMLADEIDAFAMTAEGDPLKLAERRTMAHPDRKIICGSTPTEEGISNVERLYAESDRRVFEIPCPSCGERFEMLWEHLHYDPAEPDPRQVYAVCPANGCLVDERFKRQMVQGGIWRPTRPEVKDHHGYRMNALVSLLAKAAWPVLVQEYETAKRGGPAELQVFYNTALGLPWKTGTSTVTADALRARVEDFGEDRIPAGVVLITAGVDVQDDRLEIGVVGHSVDGQMFALAHHVIPGNTLDDDTWKALDEWHKRAVYKHPNGWQMAIDGMAIDSGGSKGRTQKVYNFCGPRAFRRIFAIKGASGPRPIWGAATKPKNAEHVKLFLVGHDQVKTHVIAALATAPVKEDGTPNRASLRVSEDLPHDWFDQASGEVRRIVYQRNRPVIQFEPKRPGQRVEALDCLCYAWALTRSPAIRAINLQERAARRPDPATGQVAAGKRLSMKEMAARFHGSTT